MNKHKFIFNSIIDGDINAIKQYIITEKEYFHEDAPMLLSLACLYDNFSIVKIVMEEFKNNYINTKNKNTYDIFEHGHGDKCLVNVIRNENLDMLQYLVDNGLDIFTKQTTLLYNPLVLAASVGNLSIVQYLVEQKVSIEQWGHLSLQAASMTLSVSPIHNEVIRYLVEQGACVNNNNNNNNNASPLESFVTYNNKDMVQLFIEHGADINCDHGEPLKIACEKNNFALAKTLIDNGADINLDNAAALQNAINQGNLDIVRYLLKHNSQYSTHTTSTHAISEENLFICLKVAIERINNYASIAKDHLYKKESENIVLFLISKGADFHLQDEYCLNVACKYENKDMAAYFLQQGSTPSFTYDNPLVSQHMKTWLADYYKEHILDKFAQKLEENLDNSSQKNHQKHKI